MLNQTRFKNEIKSKAKTRTEGESEIKIDIFFLIFIKSALWAELV